MSHLDYKVKAELTTTCTTKNYDTELHKAGCKHEARMMTVREPRTPPTADDGFTDDWYHVAPCAR